MSFGFGSSSLTASARRRLANIKHAQSELDRALAMALLCEEAKHHEGVDKWLRRAECAEADLICLKQDSRHD